MKASIILLLILPLAHAEKMASGGASPAPQQAKKPLTQPNKAAPAQESQAPANANPNLSPNPAAQINGTAQSPPTGLKVPPVPKLSKKKATELERKKLEEKNLQLKIKSWTAGGPDRNTDWEKYEYPANYRGWASGDVGLANIGNGICTKKNAERAQVKLGYCQMLTDILKEEGSCANTAIKTILPRANQGKFGDLHLYCAHWHSLNEDEKIQGFVQVLSGLITKESGWNPNAQEQPWVRRDGKHMGGMGLFQIGVDDRKKDKDCAELTNTTIFDPKTNMRCGACIALKFAARDSTMGHGTGDSRARGIAVYFSPFRDHHENPPANKRPEIQAATQTYCRAGNLAEK